MMKNLLMIIALAAFTGKVSAQNDTLLFENFDFDPTANWALFNSGNDTGWVDFDLDALPDANGRPQNWFWEPGAFSSVDSIDGSIWSSSWLSVLPPQVNRNWLITPPIQIVDASANLSWASAPRQTPRYVDGYTVLVSTTTNFEADFTDTIFQAAQYLTGTGNDWSTYTFSPGFVHGLDGSYIEYDGDSSRFVGVFRPFSVSLAQYSGQTIYIAFLHDSDDDNLIALDDITVTGTFVGLNEIDLPKRLTVFPNPAKENIELSYMLPVTSPVTAEIFDVKGAKVLSIYRGIQIAGSQKLDLNVSSLAAGTYNIRLKAGKNEIHSGFVKQ